jgi:glycosyltransferase involved in cell wall biosynthesis
MRVVFLKLNKFLYLFESKYPKTALFFFKCTLGAIVAYVKLRTKIFGRNQAVLFSGQAYYNAWYLSRALRNLGWKADVLNWDLNPGSQIYYHGEDFKVQESPYDIYSDIFFYLNSLVKYDVFHFSNAGGILFGTHLTNWFKLKFGEFYEIHLLKSLGKKIVYSNNGCLDGVSQKEFSKWGPESICSICRWKNVPEICNDEKNLKWGSFRNQMADYQCLFGGNRIDYNNSPSVHEVPEFYCLNKDIWHPELLIPDEFKLPKKSESTVYFYHAVGNKKERTDEDGVNIKSSHVYLPLIDKLREEGMHIELISPEGVPNKDVRYYQLQADLVLEMLTYGWYGANAREAMMLGKPVICYIRPEWLDDLRYELPECADELPIISATPHTVEAVIRNLLANPEQMREVGRKSREFSLKWHSDTAAAKRFDEIYSKLLRNNYQHLQLRTELN